MKFLTRKGYLIEEQGMTYLADTDPDLALGPLQAAACTYHIAFGPRVGQKVLSLQPFLHKKRRPPRGAVSTSRALASMPRCAAPPIRGRNSEARARDGPAWRAEDATLCRYIIRPERLARNRAGQVVLTLKTPYREGTTHIVMSPLEFIQRLAALVPRPRLHLIRFDEIRPCISPFGSLRGPNPFQTDLSWRARARSQAQGGPAWRAEDAAPGYVPTSFRTCRSTPIHQRTTLRCPLPRRLPP